MPGMFFALRARRPAWIAPRLLQPGTRDVRPCPVRCSRAPRRFPALRRRHAPHRQVSCWIQVEHRRRASGNDAGSSVRPHQYRPRLGRGRLRRHDDRTAQRRRTVGSRGRVQDSPATRVGGHVALVRVLSQQHAPAQAGSTLARRRTRRASRRGTTTTRARRARSGQKMSTLPNRFIVVIALRSPGIPAAGRNDGIDPHHFARCRSRNSMRRTSLPGHG